MAVRRKRTAPEVAVIGAGVFGAWTALHLLELGARVTLVDAWGAGHLRGTSCDESRVIRCGYGARSFYTAWAWRALAQWKQFEKQAGQLFVPAGVLWLCAEENEYARASQAALKRLKIPVQRFDARAVAKRYPQFDYRGITFAYHEPKAGYLRARLATMAVADAVKRAGGRVVIAQVEAPSKGARQTAPLREIRLADGATLSAEHFVFACGPWLPQMFPALLGRRILVTQQDVFYFGPPAGSSGSTFTPPRMPVWLDPGPHFYGIPSAEARGVKVADDWSGPKFDPTHGERKVLAESVEAARAYLRLRLPALGDAPILETRVCQYERTPDSNVVIDRHPRHGNVWLVGGGSGHGYKLGPALGEFVARHVLGKRAEPIADAMRLGASEWPAGTERPQTTSL